MTGLGSVSAAASVAATAAGRCAVCGEPEPLGGVLCTRCSEDGSGTPDTLVVVQNEERAYVRVSSLLAELVVLRLAEEGCTARAVPASRAWMALPRRVWRLVVSVLVAGVAAALVAVPSLGIVTLIVAGALLVAADDAMRRPMLAARAEESAPELPHRLRKTVTSVLDALPAGDARRLLADVVRRARPLLAEIQRRPDDRRTLGDVSDLVEASCDIAAELARVDAFLALPGTARTVDTTSRCNTMRELLTRRLADAASAIDAMLAQMLVEESPASDRVAELASELTAEASARRAAFKELDQIV